MKTNLVIFPHNIDGMEGAVAVSFTLHSIMFMLTVLSSQVKTRLEFFDDMTSTNRTGLFLSETVISLQQQIL